MKSSKFTQKLYRWWKLLSLTDKFLLTFMIILQVQSGHNLFFHGSAMQDAAMLDVVVRTTSAAIFGYFISAGFRGDANEEYEEEIRTGIVRGKGKDNCSSAEKHGRRIRQQTIIVSVIGISSLIMLALARNSSFITPTATATATLSQLRDFVSGSVGFLIGHSSKDAK